MSQPDDVGGAARWARRRVVGGMLALVSAPALAAGEAAAGAGSDPGAVGSDISPVEQWLFLDGHLKTLKPPVALRYAVDISGELKPADHHELTLAVQAAQGRWTATLTTPRAEASVPLDSELFNPIVAYFLDRDVETMERLTGGKKGYFNRRLRKALAGATTIAEVQAESGGKMVSAREVSLQPYLDDPLRPRFERFAAKRYRFTLAKATPGQVLRIETVIPGANGDFTKPLLTETLSFAGQR